MIQFGPDELRETSVAKLLRPLFVTSQPKHSTEEAIDEIERVAWFSKVNDQLVGPALLFLHLEPSRRTNNA